MYIVKNRVHDNNRESQNTWGRNLVEPEKGSTNKTNFHTPSSYYTLLEDIKHSTEMHWRHHSHPLYELQMNKIL